MLNTRKAKSLGDPGGGGWDYQAEAYALVASKILAGDSLGWVDSGCNRVPVSVRLETGIGGDDLRINFEQGKTIELQAKSGRLRRGADLWKALLRIAKEVEADPNTHGVLLISSRASRAIKEQLKDGLLRLGEGVLEDSAEIVKDFVEQLQDVGIDLSVCSRIRVVIRDFEPGSSGESETLDAIKKSIAEPEKAGLVRGFLVSDGLDLTSLRNGRDAASITRVLTQNGIQLSSKTINQLVLKEAFLDWSRKISESFSIPSLNVALPISKAWVRLRAMPVQKEAAGTNSLEDQIKNYHEWYRLTHTSSSSKAPKIESITRKNRLLVVVGGPGSGKSTLLRRLANAWSAEGRLVLRVSLRSVSLRMRNGENFDEALLAVACEGFRDPNANPLRLLRTSNCLLADGLDETDPDRLNVADQLRRWALSSNERAVVVTTRPIGHNPAWFSDWAHFELLPIDQEAVNKFVGIIFGLLSPTSPDSVKQQTKGFIEKLRRSRTASIAARNPQLMGFLIALFINGYEIDRKRFNLFSDMVEQIRKGSVPDRRFRQEVDRPTAIRFIDCLGWTLLYNPNQNEEALAKSVGAWLATEASARPLEGEKIASASITFWEERGLLERISSGVETTLTFVHMAFQEFAAARFLAQFPEHDLVEWVEANKNTPKSRQALLLLGGTARAGITVNTLLADDNPSDPAQINALLAADVLGESEDAPKDVRDLTIEHLLARLTYPVPDVVYEAGEKLKPLAIARPELIGAVALQLARHEQTWTKEVACALGLLCGDQYVNTEALLSVYPTAQGGGLKSRRGFGVELDSKPIVTTLIKLGAEYLLQGEPPKSHVKAVKLKYKSGEFPGNLSGKLSRMLDPYLSAKDRREINNAYFVPLLNWSKFDKRSRKAEIAIAAAMIAACQGLTDQPHLTDADPDATAFFQLWSALKFGKNPVLIYYEFGDCPLQDALIEVIRGAILVSSLQPPQVKVDAERVLSELRKSGRGIYDITKGLKRTSKLKPKWTLAQESELRPKLLFDALSHPSWYVSRFAALLLWNCFDRSFVRTGLRPVLATTGSRNALNIISQVSKELWQNEAAELILRRLEENLTPGCHLLLRMIDPTWPESALRTRLKLVLRASLVSKEPKLVGSAIEVIEKLDLGKKLAESIRQSYVWWLHEGPLDPVGSGVVPENPVDTLFSHLMRIKGITFEQACEAARIRRSDLRKVAIKAIGQFLEQDKELVDGVIDDVLCERLPVSVIDELSISHPRACSGRLESFLKLLESYNQMVQIACIRALGDGWAERPQVEPRLRSLLTSSDLEIRNEAHNSLRRLATKILPSPS